MIPRIAVVGHPNKGKSSIVATLAEDDGVGISHFPGTTTKARAFPLRVDTEVLYELIDTPGFQRARETLAWLEAHGSSADGRAGVVAEFVSTHLDDERFRDECELLTPLMGDAGILYVVDGSKPYGPEYEAEMQVLRWTGRPRMALINLIGPADHIDEWRRALDQFFSIVRVFDATRADFARRIELLRGFAELSEGWRDALERAVVALQAERQHRQHASAVEIADLLIHVVAAYVTQDVATDADLAAPRQRLTEQLFAQLRERERRARERVQAIYQHERVVLEEPAMRLLDVDLFSAAAVNVFGLSPMQLAATGAVSGVVVGGGLDAMVGGLSFGIGASVGALVGGLGALIGSSQLARTKVLGLPIGGRELKVGPISDANIPWVVLGRAVLHQRLVAERNHARREIMVIDASGVDIPAGQRGQIDRRLGRIRNHGGANREERDALVAMIEALLDPQICGESREQGREDG